MDRRGEDRTGDGAERAAGRIVERRFESRCGMGDLVGLRGGSGDLLVDERRGLGRARGEEPMVGSGIPIARSWRNRAARVNCDLL